MTEALKTLFVFVALADDLATAADVQPSFADIAKEVNVASVTWTAVVPARFESHDAVRSLCGTVIKEEDLASHDETVQPIFPSLMSESSDMPKSFDARSAFPACSVIGHVGDQGACGSCWAFSATQAFESSLCVATGEDVVLSKEDTAECCSGALCGYSVGCKAGTPRAALTWMKFQGVVTGGDYGSSDGCKPYVLAPCSHVVDPTSPFPTCHEPSPPPALTCVAECSNANYSTAYAADKRKPSGSQVIGLAYRGDAGAHVMAALMANGPVSATMTVMEDFPTYDSGVYTHVTGGALGGHAVTIVGWGVLPASSSNDATPYWLVKNSWSEHWGEDGFFRIRRGTNEVGIEGETVAISFNGWKSSFAIVV